MSNGAFVIEHEDQGGGIKARYLHPHGTFRILYFASESDALNFADDNKLEVRDARVQETGDDG